MKDPLARRRHATPRLLALVASAALALAPAPGAAQEGELPISLKQQQELSAQTGVGTAARLGNSMAMDGNTLLVSAPRALVTGGDGAPTDAGAVFVFRHDGQSGWQWVQTLSDPFASGGDEFGIAVAISGNVIVVGARLREAPPPATGTNNGAVYVYEPDPTIPGWWRLEERLYAGDAAAGDFFGAAVDVDDDALVVGARGKDVAGLRDAGAAYIFERDDSGWTQVRRMTAQSPEVDHLFGQSVGIWGGFAGVGSPSKSGRELGHRLHVYERERPSPEGDWGLHNFHNGFAGLGTSMGFDNGLLTLGSPESSAGGWGLVAVFERAPGERFFRQWTVLRASEPHLNARLGSSVSVSGNTVVAGAPFEGAVYRWERVGFAVWRQIERLVPENFEFQDLFGSAVAVLESDVDGDGETETTIVAGALSRDGAGGPDSGEAFVFGLPVIPPSSTVPRDVLENMGSRVVIGEGVTIESGVILGDDVVVEDGAKIFHDAVIGDDVLIGADAKVLWNSDIGANTEIGPGAVVGAFAVVGPDSEILGHVSGYATVGANATIEEDARIGIGTYGDNLLVAAGASISNGADVGDNVTVSNGARVRTGVKLYDDVSVGANADIKNGVRLGERVEIGIEGEVGARTEIGDGSLLGLEVKVHAGATLGIGVVVGAQTEIHRAVIEDFVRIGQGVWIGNNVTIGTRVTIGSFATVENGSQAPAGAVIPAYCTAWPISGC